MLNNRSVPTQERIARLELHRSEIIMRQYSAHMETTKTKILRLLDRRIQALKEKAA